MISSDPKKSRWLRGRRRFRLLWRTYVRSWWEEYEWPVLGVLAVTGLGLGYVGFAKHFGAIGEPRLPWDFLYLSLQLFVLESGSIEPPIGWELEVARWLAPFVAGYTAVQALAVLFADQLQLFRLRLLKDHVVICGLGRKGALLAASFLELGKGVVVIEQDGGNGRLQTCREQGALIVLGDVADRQVLRRAAVHQAHYVIAVCSSDSVNAEVAVFARELRRERRGQALTCLIHVADPQLYELLREQELAVQGKEGVRLEFFNIFNTGARRLLNHYPIFSETCAGPNPSPHLLLVGLGRLGEHLVVQAARSWRATAVAARDRLRLTLIDPEAELEKALWGLRYPQLETVCDLTAHPISLHSPDFLRAGFLRDVTTVYVCFDEEAAGLSAAMSLQQRLRRERVPIVVCTMEEAGLAALLRRTDDHEGRDNNLQVFGLLDQTCNPDLLPGGTHEILARLMHEDYVQQMLKAGQTSATNPALVSWDRLSEEFKESNRLQADHIGLKLAAIGCGLEGLPDWSAESFQLTPQEVESLAKMEHQRWMAERLLGGWTYAPARDDQAKTNPKLVSWEALPEAAKEENREAMRKLPAFLAEAGFQIVR